MRKVYAYNDDSRNGCARDVCRDGKYCKYKFCKDAHPNLRGKVDDIKYSTFCKYGSMESCVRRTCYFSHHSFYSREEFNSLKRSRQEQIKKLNENPNEEPHEKKEKKEKTEEPQEKKEKNEEPQEKKEKKEKNEEVIRMTNIYAGLCDEYCKYIQNISCSSATEPGEIAPIDLDKLRDNYCILRESYNNLVKSFSSI